ncbi:MAG: element excision factor XisH family protein [Thermostichus sp. HHBFW_bins_43]
MPKLDIIHNAVKKALIKDGWLVTDDPYVIQYQRTVLYADLGAERPIAVERNGQKLVVEAKSFVGASKIQDLKEALGQYSPFASHM